MMDMADLLATKGVGGGEGDIVRVMVGVAELTRLVTLASIYPIIIHGFISDELMERIIGHEGELQTIIQHRIAQGKVEIAVAVGIGDAGIVREPMLIAGIQQKCMLTVQVPVDRQAQRSPHP